MNLKVKDAFNEAVRESWLVFSLLWGLGLLGIGIGIGVHNEFLVTYGIVGILIGLSFLFWMFLVNVFYREELKKP